VSVLYNTEIYKNNLHIVPPYLLKTVEENRGIRRVLRVWRRAVNILNEN
jgi:hypothetical protein